MVALAAGLAVLVLVLVGAGAFARASVPAVKVLLVWFAALGGLGVVVGLLLTGRGAVAFSGLLLLGPLAWRLWQGRARPSAGTGPMDRTEAFAVLGLLDGASDADVREAWVRLMRTVHPDGGGSDWLASRVNQAKDILLRR